MISDYYQDLLKENKYSLDFKNEFGRNWREFYDIVIDSPDGMELLSNVLGDTLVKTKDKNQIRNEKNDLLNNPDTSKKIPMPGGGATSTNDYIRGISDIIVKNSHRRSMYDIKTTSGEANGARKRLDPRKASDSIVNLLNELYSDREDRYGPSQPHGYSEMISALDTYYNSTSPDKRAKALDIIELILSGEF